MATFDSLKEASWCTDCNAKNQNSFQWTIFDKWDLTVQKVPKSWTIFLSLSCFFPQKLIIFIGCLNAFMKCLDPQISIQQKLAILEKIGKNCKKGVILFGPFGRSSCIFSKMVHPNEFWFFALQSVHQGASFKLSNIAIWQFSFCHLCKLTKAIFEKKMPTCLKLVEIQNQKHFWKQ